MCGIAGIIDFTGRPIDQALLRAFCDAQAHRGPDDRGLWRHESPGFSVGLAHTRLAVIDPSPEAHQPMLDPTGRWAITYNGELYNYRELRDELPGPFRTASDTEVALRACIAWGPDALLRFDAMWALAVVDVANRTGHLSRDPFGIKPLYYACYDHKLVFASELRALRCLPDLPTEIDPDALACYLNLGFIPHPRTIYRHVHKLPPGHVLHFGATGPAAPEPYHRIEQSVGTRLPLRDAACELRHRIETSVARQRVADVPLGAFLSGGLDSSIIVACLAKAAGANTVKTFSIGYADHPRYDETHYARIVAERFGTEHHAFRLTFKDVLDTIEPMLDHLGEPFADSSLLPTALVSRHTRQHVTVALSGDGGDELFGGYWRYLGHHWLARYHRLPAFLRRWLIEPLLASLPTARSTRWLDRVRQAQKLLRGDLPDPLDRHLAWARYMDDELAADLLGPEPARRAAAYLKGIYEQNPSVPPSLRLSVCPPLRPSVSPSPPLSPSSLQAILLADLTITLPADMLYKVDTASMAHSLEVRVPLLSPDVVCFAAGLPIEYKIAGTQTKRILREAFRDVLPAPILTRRKMGFEVPIGEFLRRQLRDLYHDLVTPSTLCDLGIHPETAARLYADHSARRADHADLLWALLVLCRWRQAGRVSPEAPASSRCNDVEPRCLPSGPDPVSGHLTDLTFDEWLAHVFDHPATRPAWYWDTDADDWDGPPATTVRYMTRLFEHAGELLAPFSDAQVNQGLSYIIDNACSSHFFAILDEETPLAERERCIRAIHTLFEACFAKRFARSLPSLASPADSPLHYACYMWWDILPVYGYGGREDPSQRQIAQACLDVMGRILEIPSELCQRSALRGLGHWHDTYPTQVEHIIDSFLNREPRLSPNLRQYALDARRGSVQ